MLRSVPTKFVLTSGVAFVCTALLGCGLGQNNPREVARDFVAAAQDGDQNRAASTLTSEARENVGTSVRWLESSSDTTHGFQVSDAQINGDSASVPITLTDTAGSRDADLHLRREDGKWRVAGIELKSGIGPTLDVDFEHPENTIGSAFRTAGQALGVVTRGMEQGANQFAQGFDEGYKNGEKSETQSHAAVNGKTTIEEITPPPSAR